MYVSGCFSGCNDFMVAGFRCQIIRMNTTAILTKNYLKVITNKTESFTLKISDQIFHSLA